MSLTTLPPYCAVVMICGNLNLLDPSGPLQACNGTDLIVLVIVVIVVAVALAIVVPAVVC